MNKIKKIWEATVLLMLFFLAIGFLADGLKTLVTSINFFDLAKSSLLIGIGFFLMLSVVEGNADN